METRNINEVILKGDITFGILTQGLVSTKAMLRSLKREYNLFPIASPL